MSQFIVHYAGSTFDVEKFIDSHPAGAAIIEPFRDKDMTEAFDAVGHSSNAMKILNKHKIATTEQGRNPIKKLFTNEDPFYFHKLFGAFSLFSFAYRYCYVLPMTGTLGFDGSYFDAFTLFAHWTLSVSSLIFHVLEKRIVDRPLIIYEEYRLHAILFSTRAILVSVIGIYARDLEPRLRQCLLWSTLLCIHLLVDWVTRKHGTTGVTAVRNNNDGKYKYIRLFYSYYQICALGSHLLWTDELNDLGFNTIVAIQSSAFLMTLKRKSIIRWKSHMGWYSFALLLSYVVMWRTRGAQFFMYMAIVFFIRTQFNMNKYLLWSGYAAFKCLRM